MKYIIIRFLWLNVLIMFIFNTVSGEKVYDVLSGATIETQQHVKEMNPKSKFFRMEVEVTYFHITNPQTKGDFLLNETIEEFCMDYLQNDAKALAVLAEWQLRAKVMEELRYSSYNSQNGGTTLVPHLTEIQCYAISLLNNEITFGLDFTFSVDDDNADLNISYYFSANRLNGSIVPLINRLNDNELTVLQDRMSAKINDTYKFVTSKLSTEDMALLERYDEDFYEDEDEEEPKVVCTDICTRMDFSEASFFWYGWGVVVEFQKFTNSSKIYFGNSFSYFIPLDEARKMFQGLSGFEYLNQINAPVLTISNMNLTTFLQNINDIRSQPNLEKIVSNSNLDKRHKRLNINRYQISTDGSKRFMGKTVLEFNTDGRLTKKENFEGGNHLYSSIGYIYTESGQLIEEKIISRNEEEITTYQYDSQNNLTSVKRVGDNELSESQYYYSGNAIYSFEIYPFQVIDYDRITKYSINEHRVCIDEICYILNTEGKLIGVKSEKYTMYNGQIGYNNKGQIVEYHTDNDRYHYYWTYDEKGRLVHWISIDGVTQNRELIFEYKGGEILPNRSSDNQISYGNKTEIVEEMEWE